MDVINVTDASRHVQFIRNAVSKHKVRNEQLPVNDINFSCEYLLTMLGKLATMSKRKGVDTG
jgi:hypothetical protein